MILKIAILLIACVTISESSSIIPCANDTVCKCTEIALQCKCQNTDTIELQSYATHDWKRVIVQDCNFLEISIITFLSMHIEEAVFENINQLKIRPFSFSAMNTLVNFRLENIKYLDIGLFGISGLSDLQSFRMINVTAPNLSSFAISGSNITLVEIENSSLTLDSFSIVVSSIDDVFIKNSDIHSVSNASLIIRTADRVHFQNSVFAGLTERAIVILWTQVVEILNCSFADLASSFLFGHANHFLFNENIIKNSETDAFAMISVTETAEFKNNKFLTLGTDSIFPNPNNNVTNTIEKISVSGNQFHCDCRLAWLFTRRDIYSPIIHSSVCYNHKQVSLSQMNRFFFSNETCNFNGYDSTRILEQMNIQALKDNMLTSTASLLSNCMLYWNVMINLFLWWVKKIVSK